MSEKVDKIRRFLADSIISREINGSTNSSEALSDEEAFLQRLSTYSSFVWSVKPRVVAAPVCASLGWAVAQNDLLECVSCRQFLSTELPPVWKKSSYDQAVSLLVASLTDKHHAFCPWPLNMSKQSYLHERFLDEKSALNALATTLVELNRHSPSHLPNLSSDLPEKLLNLLTCEELLETAASLMRLERAKLQNVTLILAICGWQTRFAGSDGLNLFCTMCFRQTEAQLYASPAKEEDSPNIVSQSSEDSLQLPKRRRVLEIRKFNPLNEHQSWCPWVDSSYAAVDGSQMREGWSSLLELFTTHSRDKQTKRFSDKDSLRNGLLNTKRIVRKWISDATFNDVMDALKT